MPPNRPLSDILVTGRPSGSEYRVLTPRTPHSRAGRAEEGFSEIELQDFQDDESRDYRNQQQEQAQPLLSSGYRSRGDDHDTRVKNKHWTTLALDKAPLFGGSLFAVGLLVLFIVSLVSPGRLEATLLKQPGDFLGTSAANVAGAFTSDAPLPSSTSSMHDSAMSHGSLISYENYTQFPLTGNEYRAECNKIMGGFMHHGEYWDSSHGSSDVEHHDDMTDYHLPEGELTTVCKSTVTYMLDGHVGLVADLALMAQAAALARERNRTFFVDDTHWNRGKWTDHFQHVRSLDPGPEPGCVTPPPDELVACPRTARHWVMSSRTALYHLGHSFSEEYEDPFGHHMNRLKPIYEHARISFEEVIRPNAHIAALIRAAREELVLTLSPSPPPPPSFTAHGGDSTDEPAALGRDSTPPAPHTNPSPYIGVHIRRGDRQAGAISLYPDHKVPLGNFVTGAREAWNRFYPNSSVTSNPVPAGVDYADIEDADSAQQDVSSGSDGRFPAPPIVWLASDSPPAAREFANHFSSAAAVFSLDRSTNPKLRALAPVHEYVQAEFNEEPEEERVRLTRGMIVDLAMVSGLWAWPGEVVPGAVVCGEGSNVCKMSALGFGFEHAFGFDDDGDYSMGEPNQARARWVDVDVAGRIVPAWRAFERH